MLDPSKSSTSQNVILRHVNTFCHYAKARSLIFIFPWATFISVLIAANGFPDPITTVMIVGASYFILLAIYSYNDVVDLNVDRINDPNRPIASGRVSKKEVIRLVWILNGSALILTSMINLQTTVIASILILLGVIYSHPKTNYKDRFPLKTLITAVGAALASLMGGLAVGGFSPQVMYAALLFFLFESVLAMLGDIHDLHGDKAAGRRTFPIVAGIKATIMLMTIILTSIAITTILINELIQISIIGLLMIIILCTLGTYVFKGLFFNYNNRYYIGKTRRRMRYIHIFLQLSLFLGIIF